MRALPVATGVRLPQSPRRFKSASRSWRCQLYYRDPRLHWEAGRRNLCLA